jgi:hypothetical protein
MNFSEALEALRNEKKVRRHVWSEEVYLFYDPDRSIIIDTWTNQLYDPTQTEVLADDWEIVEDIPEAKPEDWKVIPKYKEWLDKNIRESCGCVESGHVYYVQCMEKLNELLYKQQTIWRGEKCERLIVSLPPRYGNSEIVSRRIPAYKPTQEITHEICTIILINGNKTTVKTESGGHMIINLPSVEL